MTRGRKKLSLTREELQAVVDMIEGPEPNRFPSLAAMWKAVAETDWAKSLKPRPLTAQVAMLRAKELGVVVKTAAGKIGKGRAPGGVASDKKKFFLPVLVEQTASRETPSKYKDLLAKAQAGSRKAALKLKCLECSNWQPSEVAYCPILGCPLWQFRPYQRANHPVYTSETIEDCNKKLEAISQ